MFKTVFMYCYKSEYLLRKSSRIYKDHYFLVCFKVSRGWMSGHVYLEYILLHNDGIWSILRKKHYYDSNLLSIDAAMSLFLVFVWNHGVDCWLLKNLWTLELSYRDLIVILVWGTRVTEPHCSPPPTSAKETLWFWSVVGRFSNTMTRQNLLNIFIISFEKMKITTHGDPYDFECEYGFLENN